MKALKYIACSAFALTMVACSSGFLRNESPTAMTPADVFSNEIRTEQTIFGVYERMGANNGYRNRLACGYQGLNTDIEWSSKSTDSKTGSLMKYDCPISQSDVSSTNGSDIWSYLNTMIERCNDIIEGVEEYGNIKENEKMQYFLGEALFLRSFAYLEQVKFWGDIPARFVSIDKDPSGMNAKKTDRNEVYEHLRADLSRAAELMPWSEECPGSAKNNVGRPSRSAALGLLARADLMYAGKAVRPLTIDDPNDYKVDYNIQDLAKRAEVYKEALEACAQIINHEDKLAENFETPFRQICSDVTAYDKMEHIWVMPFADGARGQVLNYNAPKLSSTAQNNVPGHLHGYAKGGSSGGHICVTPTLIYKFDKKDKRREVTYVLGQWEYDNAASNVCKNDPDMRSAVFDGLDNATPRLYQKVSDVAHYYSGKFRFEWMAAGRELSGTDDGVDFPVLRYADILLMFAEAEMGGIGGDKPVNNTGVNGLNVFNRVRTRAGVATKEPITMEDIMDERAFEFCGEYIRKYDLMRWGNLREVMVEHEKRMRIMANDLNRNNQLNIGDSLFYHYVFNKEIGGWEAKADAGLAVGEKSRPATSEYTYPGIAKDIFNSDSKGAATNASNYPIYQSEEQLESRQYWPIFSTNVEISNGTLWNNYGYK